MTVDKFARHISKRHKINDLDFKDLIKKVENAVSDNISHNLNYIEDKVVENFKYGLEQNQLGISNFEKELKTLNKRSLENVENINNVIKRVKFCEDEVTTFDRNNIIEKISNFEIKVGDVEKQISDISNLQQETQKVIVKLQTDIQDTTRIDNIQKTLTNDLLSKFESFSTMIYDRVSTEVKHFKGVHDEMNKNTKDIEKKLNLHLLLHKKDVDQLRLLKNEFNIISPKVLELQSLENVCKKEIENIKMDLEPTLQNYNNIALNILDLNKKVDEIKNLSDTDLKLDANIHKIIKDIKSLEDFVKNENINLKANIEKINEIMGTKITEVVFFNAKERIKGFKNDVENLLTIRKEIVDNLLNGRQINELSLTERQTVNNISTIIENIVKKLNEELNKIDDGMGELDAILNAPSLKFLNTKIKDNLNDVSKEINTITEYLKEQDKVIVAQKLKKWDDTYKSYWDNYFFKS